MVRRGAVGSLRGRLLRRLAGLLALLMVFSGWSAYWNGREAADTAYDRTLLASARAIADGLIAQDGELRTNVPYVALDTFAYDSAGRIYYQVLDPAGTLVSGYEHLPAPPPGTPRTDDYPALARFYDGEYRGEGVRLVSLLQPVTEPQLNGIAEPWRELEAAQVFRDGAFAHDLIFEAARASGARSQVPTEDSSGSGADRWSRWSRVTETSSSPRSRSKASRAWAPAVRWRAFPRSA